MATVFVEVRFLKDTPAIIGSDFKTYGPFKKGDVAALPKANASILIKMGAAEKRYALPKKPPLKKIFKGEVLIPYIEAARVKPLVPELKLEQTWSALSPNTRKSMLLESGEYPYVDIDITVKKNWNDLSVNERRAIEKAWKAIPEEDEGLKRAREKVEKVLKEVREARRE